MLQDSPFSSQINDRKETGKRKNYYRLKTEHQPNARFVDLVWILILTVKGFFFKTEKFSVGVSYENFFTFFKCDNGIEVM